MKFNIYFLLTIFGLYFLSFNIKAQEEWQVLILTTPDVSVETIAASSLALAYQKTDEAITTQLVSADIEVSDKSLLTSNADINELTDQQLFSLNRDDINLAIRYRININAESSAVIKKWRINISAYLVDLETKKKIETHNEERLFSGLPSQCDTHCFDNWLAKQAEALAQDLGFVLVEKLNNLPRRYRYEITFNRFTPNELIQIHDYLKKVAGYVHSTLLEKHETKQEWLHQIEGRKYRYISHMPADVLDVALQKQLSHLGIPVRNAKNDGRHFIIVRSGIAYFPWYITACLALILLLYSLYAIPVRKKHQRALSSLEHGKNAQQWLDYYKKMALFAVPKMKAWYAQEKQILDNIKKSLALNEQAWLCADKGDYENAKLTVEQALAINADNKPARELKDNIVDFQRGYDRYILASKEVETHPEQAKKLLDEAKLLNPHLTEKLTKLVDQCQLKIHKTDGAMVLQQAEHAIEQGNYYLAYSVIDKFISQLDTENSDEKTLSLVKQQRLEIDKQLPPLQGAVVGQQDLAAYHLFTDNKVELGRKVADPNNSFAIGYKRISRVGKQCQLARNGREYTITEQGSSNGSVYGDLLLTENQAVKVVSDKSLLLGGGSICPLELYPAKYDSDCLILKISSKSFQFIDDTNMLTAWPTMEFDIHARWILMGELLQIGIDDNDMLDIGCIKGSKPVARLSYQNGFYLQPESDNNTEALITVGQQDLYGKVPLQAGTCIVIAGHNFSFQGVSA
ncbi:MAG: hypothetical protein OCD76_21940 [Reichenbachiella sp.]